MNIMSDSLEISDNQEKADLIFCNLVKIKKALDYSIDKEMEHEFIYSMIKFARNNPSLSIDEIIDKSILDWRI